MLLTLPILPIFTADVTGSKLLLRGGRAPRRDIGRGDLLRSHGEVRCKALIIASSFPTA